MRNLLYPFALFVLFVLTAPLTPPPLLAQEPETTAPVAPPDDPRRPQEPPGVDRSPNPLWLVLGAPLRLMDRWFYNWARNREEKCGSMAAGIGSSACAPGAVSFRFGSVGSKSTFFGLGFGVHANRADPSGFKAGFTTAATVRTYQEHTAYVGWNDPARRPYVRLTGFYDFDTRNEFFGLGPDSDEDDQSDYGMEQFGANLEVGVPPRFGIWGKGGARYQKDFLFSGWNESLTTTKDIFPEVPGVLDPQRELWGPFGEVVIDLTDAPGHPIAGVKVKARGALYRSVNDLDFNWYTYGGEVQGHLPLGSQWHILSGMVGFDQAEPEESDDEIPFTYLPYLGGSRRLRGYDTWRFMDRAAAYGTVEYRYRIWHESYPDPDTAGAIETALFYDFGEVGDDLDEIRDEFDFGEKYSYGLEFRGYMREQFIFRTGIARGDEGTRFNFTFSDIY